MWFDVIIYCAKHLISRFKLNSVSRVLHVCVKRLKMDPGLILPAWQDLLGHLAAAQFGCVDRYSAR